MGMVTVMYAASEMLRRLNDADAALPALLASTTTKWNSMLIDYEKPFVERLWLPFHDGRLYLHRILPCDTGEALYHPHPWPSAVKVMMGSYETGVGYGPIRPVEAARFTLRAGSSYAIVDPLTWHWVRPDDFPSYSIMVTGAPFQDQLDYRMGNKPTVKPLDVEAAERVLQSFRNIYGVYV